MHVWFRGIFHVVIGFALVLGIGLGYLLYTLQAALPSVESLGDVKLQVPLRVYSADNKLIGEFGEKRRTPVRLKEVPPTLIKAILATEDARFYEHHGVDMRGIARAAFNMITRGTKEQGGSTITMQVARNFFLSREKTFTRKFNEILLAIKIENELSKDQILELYLNKIYFGKRAYGVVAAAQVYYGKTLKDLQLDEMAMIAGLPQAPSAINPLANPEGALKRRNHVLSRMLEYGFITQEEYQEASKKPLSASYHERVVELYAPHVAETVRQDLVHRFGEEVYTAGVSVYTTIDSALQIAATQSIRSGLHEYDQRHGYRGPITHLTQSELTDQMQRTKRLQAIPRQGELLVGVVSKTLDNAMEVILEDGSNVPVLWPHLQWARKALGEGRVGPMVRHVSDIVKVGDVVYLEKHPNYYRLSQPPEANSALVSLSPRDGRVLALVGGYSFQNSHFNRAIQAARQPGSSFKPFVYCAALLNGFTAATLVNDAPIVIEDPHQETWRPQNENQTFEGPTRLRLGIAKSRNLVSIRLLDAVGIPKAMSIFRQFGFTKFSPGLAMALGTSETSVLEMARGYSVFANGGFLIDPYLIRQVKDVHGRTLFEATPKIAADNKRVLHVARRVIPETTAFIMTSMLQDTIRMGTARQALSLKRQDIAGKTGTTQNQNDAWYVGYNPDYTTAVWVGFDGPRSLKEYGAQAALPIWIKFMEYALHDKPDHPWPMPEGIRSVAIDPETGLLARPNQKNALQEVFTEDTVPKKTAALKAQEAPAVAGEKAVSGEESLF